MTQERCHACPACVKLEATKRLAMPCPPFSHANDAWSLIWNQTLADNPCEKWDPETVAAYHAMLGHLPEAIRPNLPIPG